jgi:ABC-type multidrug transport system ATPase subunit
MSEALLQAIIKLFAIVAKEDEVTADERIQIEDFLNTHLNKNAVGGYMQQFDEYSGSLPVGEGHQEQELANINDLCGKINQELTQQQKIVIILELIGIILADGEISTREEELVTNIGNAFNVSKEEIEDIKAYVIGENEADLNFKHILIVNNQEGNPSKSHFQITRPEINGLIAILRLTYVDTYFIKYIGESDLYLNGVPLNQKKIGIFSTGSTIRGDKMNPVYYSDVVSHFMKSGDETKITFEADDIHFKFKNGKLGLREINIKEESGKLIGLMGASGAGKSTLLNVLNGHDTPSQGRVRINGIDIHKDIDQVEGVIGFVPQDDLLIEDLTVYQNLYYASKLCFDNLSEKELNELIMKALNNLGLTETKDLKVGSPLEKTISGGQRKRLNIGLELLREPSVLFVDEPTSGLSSRDSENIMDLLKELSLKGKLIFVVIHQPSSDIFKMFDKLVILDVGGYQIYYGNPVEAVVYFKKMIKMINSEKGECISCGNVNPEQIFNIIETKVVNEYGRFTNERKISPIQYNTYFKDHSVIPEIKTSTLAPPSSLNIPNKLKQIHIFCMRDVFSKLSNKQYLLINLLEAPILAFLLAFIVKYYNTFDTTHSGYIFSQNVNIPAYLFMSIIVALFMGLTVSAEEIIRDRKILKREAFLNLSRSSYLLSKVSILFILSAIQTLSFAVIGNLILEIHGMTFTYWMILFSTSCLANIIGLNISSAFNSAVTIYILIPILLIPQLILSGVVVEFDKLNPSLNSDSTVPWVGEVMASRWAFEAAMVAQFKDNKYESKFYTYDKIMAESDYRKVYYIPTLESKLEYCLNNLKSTDEGIKAKMSSNLELLRNEITKELNYIGDNKFGHTENLYLGKFDSTMYSHVNAFLETLQKFYINRYNKADQYRDNMIHEMTNTAEKKEAFELVKARHFNQSIATLVKNQNDAHRIIEHEGKLIQKVFPIYMTPHPSGIFDFRDQFYVPHKHFMGRHFDTVYFNITIIWTMSLFLMFTLYFDIPKKVVDGLSNIKR